MTLGLLAFQRMESTEFNALRRSFVDNFIGLNAAPLEAGGRLATNRYIACNPQCPHPFLNHCLEFDGDGVTLDGEDVDAALDKVLSHLASARSGYTFTVTRFSSPADLGSRLVSRGLALDERWPVSCNVYSRCPTGGIHFPIFFKLFFSRGHHSH